MKCSAVNRVYHPLDVPSSVAKSNDVFAVFIWGGEFCILLGMGLKSVNIHVKCSEFSCRNRYNTRFA